MHSGIIKHSQLKNIHNYNKIFVSDANKCNKTFVQSYNNKTFIHKIKTSIIKYLYTTLYPIQLDI